MKANAIHARQIAKAHGCAMFYMSQLSADAENKVVLNQAMMEGSRTGKAAGRPHDTDSQESPY